MMLSTGHTDRLNVSSAERSSTIGTERLTNHALQIKDKEEFIRRLTCNLPPRPDYFPRDAEINRAGAPALSELPNLEPISSQEVQSLRQEEVFALDVRPGADFVFGHVPGSVSIPLSGEFAFWAASLLGLSSRPVLIAETEEQLSETRTRLARVGVDDVRGYLKDGIEGWTMAGLELADAPQISPPILNHRLRNNRVRLLDVRRKPEWEAGHIEGASWLALDDFRGSLPELDLDRNEPIAVLCKGGYRSLIAATLLLRAGFQNVTNVPGGFLAYQKAGLPTVSESLGEI